MVFEICLENNSIFSCLIHWHDLLNQTLDEVEPRLIKLQARFGSVEPSVGMNTQASKGVTWALNKVWEDSGSKWFEASIWGSCSKLGIIS